MRALGVRHALFIAAALGGSSAAAQGVVTEDDVSYNRRTVISFDGDVIDGEVSVPLGLSTSTCGRGPRSVSLIRVREDFRREILGSISRL